MAMVTLAVALAVVIVMVMVAVVVATMVTVRLAPAAVVMLALGEARAVVGWQYNPSTCTSVSGRRGQQGVHVPAHLHTLPGR